jgi:hypothetical protein
MIYLKVLVLWVIFEMISSFEMHIVYCVAIVRIVVSLFGVAYWLIRVPGDSSESAALLICCAGNSEVLASLSYLGGLASCNFFGSRFKTRSFGLTDVHNICDIINICSY